jgi:hypothetical protein
MPSHAMFVDALVIVMEKLQTTPLVNPTWKNTILTQCRVWVPFLAPQLEQWPDAQK